MEEKQIQIQIQTTCNHINLEQLFIEGTIRSMKKGVTLQTSVIPIGDIKTLQVTAKNETNTTAKIKQGQKLGRCFQINDNWELQAWPSNVKIATNEQTKVNQENHTKQRNWTNEFHFNTTQLTSEEANQLSALFDEFQDTCSTAEDDIGKTTLTEHYINTGYAQPIK